MTPRGEGQLDLCPLTSFSAAPGQGAMGRERTGEKKTEKARKENK